MRSAASLPPVTDALRSADGLRLVLPRTLPRTLSDFAGRGYLIGEMQAMSDAQLLREYAEQGAEGAFAEIVARHTNLVYSAAARQMESPDMAAEITQRVFIALARGARTLSRRLAEDASLAGWLCRSARNMSLNLRRDEFRQHSRERQAMEHFYEAANGGREPTDKSKVLSYLSLTTPEQQAAYQKLIRWRQPK